MKKLATNKQGVEIDYDAFVKLRKSGQLELGISNGLATSLAGHTKIKGSVSAAFHFYSWIAVAIFIYSIYLSYSKHWWFFIIGIFLTKVVWSANKKGNAENIVNAALNDKNLYNRVLEMKGWMYMIEEDVLNAISKK